jgi:hypothetical protein
MVAAVSKWIRANITGDATSGSYARKSEAVRSDGDEKIRQTIEDTEFMPPPVLNSNGDVNPAAVHFLVHNLVEIFLDLLKSGVLALFAWLVFRVSGKQMAESPNQEWADKLETVAPAAIWIGCYVRLAYRRRVRRRSNATSQPM